jgi:hypothetical protein
LVFVAILLYHSAKPSDGKGLCFFSSVLLSLFAGLSYDVGWDYVNYIHIMETNSIERIEFLEWALLNFCVQTRSYQLFFLVNHILIVGLIIYSIYLACKDPFLPIIAFLCFPFTYLLEFSTIRAALVMALTLFAYIKFLRNGKVVYFTAIIIAGFFIHNISPLGLSLIPLHYMNFGRISNIVFLIICLIYSRAGISELNVSFLNSFDVLENVSSRFNYYIESEGNFGGGTMVHYVYLIFIILNIIFYNRITDNDKNIRKYILFVTVGYCMYLLFSSNQTLADRFSRNFYVFELLLIPRYVTLLGHKNRMLIQMALVSVCLGLFMYQLYIPNYNGTDPTRRSTYLPYNVFFNK